MNLHSRALRYLDEVVRCGSIRKAAAALHVASSAVNRRILLLESELGTPIFERQPGQLRLTAAGELLIHHVRRTLQDYERVQSEIEDLAGLRRGTISIAAIEGVAVDLLPTVMKEFQARYPRIDFAVTVTPSAAVPGLVASGDAHLGMSFNTPVVRGIRRVASAQFEVGAVMAPDHPLASSERVRLADCVRHTVCIPDASLSIGPLVDAALVRASLQLSSTVVCNSAEGLKAMVRDGVGVTFKSAIGMEREIAAGQLLFRPLKDRMTERLDLIAKTGRPLPVAAAVMQEYLAAAIVAAETRLAKGARPRR